VAARASEPEIDDRNGPAFVSTRPRSVLTWPVSDHNGIRIAEVGFLLGAIAGTLFAVAAVLNLGRLELPSRDRARHRLSASDHRFALGPLRLAPAARRARRSAAKLGSENRLTLGRSGSSIRTSSMKRSASSRRSSVARIRGVGSKGPTARLWPVVRETPTTFARSRESASSPLAEEQPRRRSTSALANRHILRPQCGTPTIARNGQRLSQPS
jgi:hypothetical protein